MKPVYIINGFLGSGKTEFINFTLDQPYFQSSGKTLLLLCEEGEEEYDPYVLKRSKTIVETIEEEADFTPEKMVELEKKYHPERIIIEYNGMWKFRDLRLPWHWKVEQQITTIDASTFPMYFTNMKSMVSDMIRKSEMIIFNRCDGIEDLNTYKRNVKALNQTAEIIFEDQDGEIDEIMEEDLPYDLKADKIVLDDNTYGIWYLDSLDHVDRYVGKTIEFIGMVMKPEEFPKGYFVPGRMAMTCCAEDMTFLGFACVYDKIDLYQERDWVKVTAVVKKEYFADYEGEGPVLYAESVKKASAPGCATVSRPRSQFRRSAGSPHALPGKKVFSPATPPAFLPARNAPLYGAPVREFPVKIQTSQTYRTHTRICPPHRYPRSCSGRSQDLESRP